MENRALFQKIKNGRKPLLVNADLVHTLNCCNLKFDLIYLSNVLDTKEYSRNPEPVSQVLLDHLKEEGQILMVSQKKLSKISGLVQKFGLKVTRSLKTKIPFYPFSRGYPYLYLLIERD